MTYVLYAKTDKKESFNDFFEKCKTMFFNKYGYKPEEVLVNEDSKFKADDIKISRIKTIASNNIGLVVK